MNQCECVIERDRKQASFGRVTRRVEYVQAGSHVLFASCDSSDPATYFMYYN